MNKYEKVPNIITSKDLDYLTDMFNWNYDAYKFVLNNVDLVEDDEIKKLFNDSSIVFNNNLNEIINIIGGKNE